MIKTDWVKCDRKECPNVAWIVMESPILDTHVNVCTIHYEELRNERPGWIAKDLDSKE